VPSKSGSGERHCLTDDEGPDLCVLENWMCTITSATVFHEQMISCDLQVPKLNEEKKEKINGTNEIFKSNIENRQT